MEGFMINDEKLLKKIKNYKAFSNEDKGGRVYVTNLPWSMRRYDIIKLFNNITKVHSIFMVYTKSKKFTGMAFISVKDVDKAKSINETTINGRVIYVKDANRNEKYISRIRKVYHEQGETSTRVEASE